MRSWNDFTRREKTILIIKMVTIIFVAFAIAFMIREYYKVTDEKETIVEEDVSKVIKGQPIDIKTFEEYKMLSELFGRSGDIHVKTDLEFYVSPDPSNVDNFSGTDYPTDGLEEDQDLQNEIILTGEIWKNQEAGIYKNLAQISVFGKNDEIGMAYKEDQHQKASLNNGIYVREEDFEGFTSGLLKIKDEELELLAKNAVKNDEKIDVNIPVSLFLKITGVEDFGLVSEITDKTIMIPVSIQFKKNGNAVLSMISRKSIPFSEGILNSFYLKMEVLEKAGDFEMPEFVDNELDIITLNISDLVSEEDALNLTTNNITQMTVKDIPVEERLMAPFYEQWPTEIPSGEDFANLFEEKLQNIPTEVWNVAAYITHEESQESFEKWYLSSGLWDLNTLEVKKACILLSYLGVIKDIKEEIPEGEYDSLLEEMQKSRGEIN